MQEIIEKVKKEIEKMFSGAKGSHDLEHTNRVYNLCLRIGKKEGADLDILKLAVLLHDVARPEEDRLNGKICHAEKGAVLAEEMLSKYNLDRKTIDNVMHCVKSHRFRNNYNPETIEAKVLFDADKLDSIGATGIGRAFLFAGEIGAMLHNKDINIEKTESYSRDDTAYREYLIKLKKVKDRLFTKEGRRLAVSRHKFMEDFFDRLNKEVDGEL